MQTESGSSFVGPDREKDTLQKEKVKEGSLAGSSIGTNGAPSDPVQTVCRSDHCSCRSRSSVCLALVIGPIPAHLTDVQPLFIRQCCSLSPFASSSQQIWVALRCLCRDFRSISPFHLGRPNVVLYDPFRRFVVLSIPKVCTLFFICPMHHYWSVTVLSLFACSGGHASQRASSETILSHHAQSALAGANNTKNKPQKHFFRSGPVGTSSRVAAEPWNVVSILIFHPISFASSCPSHHI